MAQNKNTKQIIKIFFGLLDCYLIGDLDTMASIKPSKCGGLNYPMLQTIMSGMELLGKVLSGKSDKPASDYFWEEFFIKDNPQYADNDLRDICRNVIKNGLAHYFLTKHRVQISKQDKHNLKLIQDQDDESKINIDALSFYKNFKRTYERIKINLLEENEGRLVEQFQRGYKVLLQDLAKGQEQEQINNYIEKVMMDDIKPIKSNLIFNASVTHTLKGCLSSSSKPLSLFSIAKD